MSERDELIDVIAKRIDTFAEHVGYGDPSVTREEAESYVAEIEEHIERALQSDQAKGAAGERLAKGALFPDQYHKDPEYKQATDELAIEVVRAAVGAVIVLDGDES